MDRLALKSCGKNVLNRALTDLQDLPSTLDKSEAFVEACLLCYSCTGKVVATGIGKSGIIARKFAATLSSTGTPAFFMHAAEASHGDLGSITHQDVVAIFSFSGSTPELIALLPILCQKTASLILFTGYVHTPIAKKSSVIIHLPITTEACPLGLAPSTSTAAMLLMSDAVALSVGQARALTKQQFAEAHPGGILGKRLSLRVRDLMKTGPRLPIVSPETSLKDTVLRMTEAQLGVAVCCQGKLVVGIFTDGDLRRAFQSQIDLYRASVEAFMCKSPICIDADALAIDALSILNRYAISQLLVTQQGKLAGIVHIQQLLAEGLY